MHNTHSVLLEQLAENATKQVWQVHEQFSGEVLLVLREWLQLVPHLTVDSGHDLARTVNRQGR